MALNKTSNPFNIHHQRIQSHVITFTSRHTCSDTQFMPACGGSASEVIRGRIYIISELLSFYINVLTLVFTLDIIFVMFPGNLYYHKIHTDLWEILVGRVVSFIRNLDSLGNRASLRLVLLCWDLNRPFPHATIAGHVISLSIRMSYWCCINVAGQSLTGFLFSSFISRLLLF